MWTPVVFEDNLYLFKFLHTTNLKLTVTDLKDVWIEEISEEDLFHRFLESNSLFEIGSGSSNNILSKIISLLKSDKPEAFMSLSRSGHDIIVECKSKLEDFPIKCKFQAKHVDVDMYVQEFIVPLLQSIQYLEATQSRLCDLLEKKDREIEEYKMEAGELTHKLLITEKFKKSFLIENAPNGLLLNLFGKSKHFDECFRTKYRMVETLLPVAEKEIGAIRPKKRKVASIQKGKPIVYKSERNSSK